MENIINGARSSLDFAQLGELKGRAQRREDSALRETAQQFEAMFLQMMLKILKSFYQQEVVIVVLLMLILVHLEQKLEELLVVKKKQEVGENLGQMLGKHI